MPSRFPLLGWWISQINNLRIRDRLAFKRENLPADRHIVALQVDDELFVGGQVLALEPSGREIVGGDQKPGKPPRLLMPIGLGELCFVEFNFKTHRRRRLLSFVPRSLHHPRVGPWPRRRAVRHRPARGRELSTQ